MVMRVGGYYVESIFGESDVTQGEPLFHQLFPVAYQCFHNHDEYVGQKWFPLSHVTLPKDGFYIVPYHPHHHMQPLTIPSEE